MHVNKKVSRLFKIIAVVISLLLFTSALRLYRPSTHLLRTSIFLFNLIVYLALLFWWAYSIIRRTANNQVRQYLLIIIFLIVLWLVIRSMKYQPFNDIDLVARHLWYAFYIPIILITMFSFLLSLNIGQSENFKMAKIYNYLYIPAIFLIVFVLTNDWHQLVFAFNEDMVKWSSDYTYEIGYYAVFIWMVGFAVLTLVTLFQKSFKSATTKKLWAPSMVIALSIAYGINYMFDNSNTGGGFVELTVAFSGFYIAFWEACIQSGLLPTNTKYKKFFNVSTLRLLIVDNEYHPHYQSQTMLDLSPEYIQAAIEEKVIPIQPDWLLKSKAIHGGHVLWLEDIEAIHQLISQLETIKQNLKSEVEVLEQEVETKAKIAHLHQQNYLYDQLLKSSGPHLVKIKNLLEDLRLADKSNEQAILMNINLLGVYIKRRSNLILAHERQETIVIHDVVSSIKESLSMLKMIEVESALLFQKVETLALEQALVMLDFFQMVVETLYLDLSRIVVSLAFNDNALIYSFHLETHHSMTHDLRWYLFENAIRNTYDEALIEAENDHVFHINYRIKGDHYES